MPPHWLSAITEGERPLANGEWVEVRRNGSVLCVGRIMQPQLYAKAKCRITAYARGASNTLTPTDVTHEYEPSSTDVLTRCHCYQEPLRDVALCGRHGR